MAKKDLKSEQNSAQSPISEKLKALQAATEKIEKSFGKGSVTAAAWCAGRAHGSGSSL